MKKVTLLLTLCLATTSYAFAGPHPVAHRTIGQRIHHQNARIRTAHREGDLTNKEARELHGEERGIREQVQTERAADGGHLTQAQHQQIERELNQDSHQIRTEKKAGE